MVCHEFKGGIGTASRVIPQTLGGHTVGVLVQANYGKRAWLRVDGVPVGGRSGTDRGPEPVRREAEALTGAAAGLRFDHRGHRDRCAAAPPPVRAARATRRSRDRPRGRDRRPHERRPVHRVRDRQRLPGEADDDQSRSDLRRPGRRRPRRRRPLRRDVIEATEEAIINALVAAQTMVGRDGITAHALPHDRLLEIMARYGRGPRTA